MRFLLAEATETLVALIIIAIGLALAVFVYMALKKRSFGGKTKKINGKLEVELKKEYVSQEEMKVIEYVHKALPKDFIAFPRVGVDQIVAPTKNLVAYNSILSKYVDICVFLRKTMQPVLVIDIVWDNQAKQQCMSIDPNVIDVLKAVKLNVIKLKLDESMDTAKLKSMILNAMPDKVVAMLKNDYIEGK